MLLLEDNISQTEPLRLCAFGTLTCNALTLIAILSSNLNSEISDREVYRVSVKQTGILSISLPFILTTLYLGIG
jgi:hypothetical protein